MYTYWSVIALPCITPFVLKGVASAFLRHEGKHIVVSTHINTNSNVGTYSLSSQFYHFGGIWSQLIDFLLFNFDIFFFT